MTWRELRDVLNNMDEKYLSAPVVSVTYEHHDQVLGHCVISFDGWDWCTHDLTAPYLKCYWEKRDHED